MRPIIPMLATCLCLLSLTGCGVTQPARFYILTPVEDSGHLHQGSSPIRPASYSELHRQQWLSLVFP